MKIQIKSCFDSTKVLFETDAETIGAAICAAVLAKANLRDANLLGADLRGAYLRDAKNIKKENLAKLVSVCTILPDGDLIGWKKLQNGVLCKLQIPAKAKRVGGLIGRKCRAEFAVVLEGEGKGLHCGQEYKVGKTVKPDKFDDDPLTECSHGIHFFITKQEAMEFN